MGMVGPSGFKLMLSIGPLYGDVLQYYHRNLFPIIEKGWTQETEHPFRQSKICLVFRFPFTKPGFVLGVWERSKGFVYDEDADDTTEFTSSWSSGEIIGSSSSLRF